MAKAHPTQEKIYLISEDGTIPYSFQISNTWECVVENNLFIKYKAWLPWQKM